MLSDRCLSVCPVCLSVTLVYCGQMVGWIKMKLGMRVGLGPGHIVLDWDPAERPSPKGGGAPQFSTHICCGQMAGWIKVPLGREVGLSPSDIVFLGTQLTLPKTGAEPPNFRPCLLWPDRWMDQDATWRGGTSRPRPHCARWSPVLPPPKVHSPQFSAHICCGQMAGWIKMPLVREVCLCPSDIVLDGDPAPLSERRRSPQFSAVSIVARLLDGSRCHLVWR